MVYKDPICTIWWTDKHKLASFVKLSTWKIVRAEYDLLSSSRPLGKQRKEKKVERKTEVTTSK